MLLGCLGRLLVTVNFAMTPAPPTTTSPNASGDGENESGASGTAMGEPGLQPVVLGMGATRPRRSALDSVNQIEVQSGPTVIPTGPELAVCAG